MTLIIILIAALVLLSFLVSIVSSGVEVVSGVYADSQDAASLRATLPKLEERLWGAIFDENPLEWVDKNYPPVPRYTIQLEGARLKCFKDWRGLGGTANLHNNFTGHH